MSQFSKVLTGEMGTYNMKLKTLAKLLHTSEEEVRGWTTGKSFPREEQIFSIAKLFDLNSMTLMDIIDSDKEAENTSKVYEYLIRRVRRLKPEEAMEIYKKLTEEAASGN